jgi:1-acyl-sn-glycerol-3-phosphate acyltransferase
LNVINKNIYDKLINDNNNDKPLIIISNHSSLFDGIILTSILGNICFLADINGLSMPGSLFINKKLGSIIINNNDIGNSHKITNYIVNRKKKDNFLIIFPDAMQPIPINSVIAPFKSGAFKDFFDILPIVIKYKNYSIDPTHFWFKGENIFNGFCKMILEDNCDIYVKILNIQERLNNEDIEDYKNRIHKIISDEYEKL